MCCDHLNQHRVIKTAGEVPIGEWWPPPLAAFCHKSSDTEPLSLPKNHCFLGNLRITARIAFPISLFPLWCVRIGTEEWEANSSKLKRACISNEACACCCMVISSFVGKWKKCINVLCTHLTRKAVILSSCYQGLKDLSSIDFIYKNLIFLKTLFKFEWLWIFCAFSQWWAKSYQRNEAF